MKQLPLVSCIMPTYNRRRFVPQAIRYFLRQDYPQRELIIVDDGTEVVRDQVPDDARIRYLPLNQKHTIGAKRNLACQEAKGEIIVHWDDDDWMAPWRLTYQVENLLKEQADLCGLSILLFYNPQLGQSWQYVYTTGVRPWVAGGTLCYTKAFWRRSPFPNINVGEDARFVWSNAAKRMVTLQDCTFYVALIHAGNTSPKRTGESCWHTYSTETIQHIMHDDWLFYGRLVQGRQQEGSRVKPDSATPIQSLHDLPLVSCILPTYNRRHLLPQAIKYFQRQDYLNRELIVVDDGTDPVGDLIPEDPRIRYFRQERKQSLGMKRNFACEVAQGEIIISWDDDDWYAPNRISYQVEPLLHGRANVTGLGKGLLMHLPTRSFWMISDQLHARMFHQGIISGTMTFWRKLWGHDVRFPDISVADDAAFLKALMRLGIHLEQLPNNGIFVYVRHDTNTWHFQLGHFLDRRGWRQVEPPSFMPEQDLEFYGVGSRADRSHQTSSHPLESSNAHVSMTHRPLVSCILATNNRSAFIKQAIKYFLKQTYDNKELVIVDDGSESAAELIPDDERIRYVRLDAHTLLGTKLNLGIKASHGQIIQKLDDDDYYHPEFLTTTVTALLGHDPVRSVVGFGSFLVLITATGELKFSGPGWCAGGTLCFHRQLWERRPFRDVPRAVDWYFLQDHAPQRIQVSNPELYILLRHDVGHLWTTISNLDVTDHFRSKPNYSKSLQELIPAEDVMFYDQLKHVSAVHTSPNNVLQGGPVMALEKVKDPDKYGREAIH